MACAATADQDRRRPPDSHSRNIRPAWPRSRVSQTVD